MSKRREPRLRRLPRTHGFRIAVLIAALAALAVLPAASVAKGQKAASPQATAQLSVFSWWTGGGEEAGLKRLIKIWNKAHPEAPFKNETVAGGAGSNAKAVLQQRLQAGKPPDSFQGHAGAELLGYIKAGQVEPVDAVYSQYGLRRVFPAGLIKQLTYKGHIYSVPVNIHRANILWFNPATLKKNSVAVPKTWGQFTAALQKCADADLVPLAVGEQWTQKHLLETVMISTIGPARWAALWKKGGNWNAPGVRLALTRYQNLLELTNTDSASLTWQDAAKLVADGKACFTIMGDWNDGYQRLDLKKKANVTYGWAAVPGSSGVYVWLSDSFTLPKGAPNRTAATQWLGFLGSKAAQDSFNPVKGSIPARKDANARLYGTYLKWALKQWKTNKLAGSLTHGVVADNAWNADVDTALGLFLQSKDVGKFQTALANAAKKRAT